MRRIMLEVDVAITDRDVHTAPRNVNDDERQSIDQIGLLTQGRTS